MGEAWGMAKGRAEGLAEGKAIGEARGEARGEAKKEYSFVVEMLQEKEPVAKIMKYTQLSLEKILDIANGIGVAVVM